MENGTRCIPFPPAPAQSNHFPAVESTFSGARFGAGRLLDGTWEGVQGPLGAPSGGPKLRWVAPI